MKTCIVQIFMVTQRIIKNNLSLYDYYTIASHKEGINLTGALLTKNFTFSLNLFLPVTETKMLKHKKIKCTSQTLLLTGNLTFIIKLIAHI